MEETILTLEEQVTDLIRLCRKLRNENAELRDKQRRVDQEVGQLQQKNRSARVRVEQIAQHLKTLGEQ